MTLDDALRAAGHGDAGINKLYDRSVETIRNIR
jgi:hypothetical protein